MTDPTPTLREQVADVVAHLLADPVAAARRDAAEYLPLLLRFAAGDDVEAEDLHDALFFVKCEARKASDHVLGDKAVWAALAALSVCEAEHRDMVQELFLENGSYDELVAPRAKQDA